ncbi:ESX-1 secretion-associated protein [Mycobacterium talmoniae]|uniref:ESX-1 secretion-associated protein n=1 Tax=Mycobacterium talmoniae TaxID=1858794 RepID=A0A1S1MPR0_9MYCO|nr:MULTISPECIES: ESX-1 secretion-associated protein [Mycobacterium]OHU86473.1 hypothetical protein BKN37_26205 [Mycobacterium talmoniae]PQM49724.1 hypothetical protein C1Y40_00045 [Mycobacterium talmoniae]TDH57279.1 ESX-1 secretion-associated protein [Mycobacterium eburneum]
MADRTHVVPANLTEAAAQHQQTAEYLRTVPSTHAAIEESLESLGPIFGGLRQAGIELLEQRRRCYQRQADAHAETAANLLKSVRLWQQQQDDAGDRFDGVVDDRQ